MNALKKLVNGRKLSTDCSYYFQRKAKGGFICGFGEVLEGFFEFLPADGMPEVKHLPNFKINRQAIPMPDFVDFFCYPKQ